MGSNSFKQACIGDLFGYGFFAHYFGGAVDTTLVCAVRGVRYTSRDQIIRKGLSGLRVRERRRYYCLVQAPRSTMSCLVKH